MISPLSGRVSPVETDGKREQVLPRVVEDPLLPITVVIVSFLDRFLGVLPRIIKE